MCVRVFVCVLMFQSQQINTILSYTLPENATSRQEFTFSRIVVINSNDVQQKQQQRHISLLLNRGRHFLFLIKMRSYLANAGPAI